MRVPAAELDAALADLKALGKVEREAQSGEEVTQQHADLVARLKNSRETEQRLREILVQRTGKIKDVLEVEQEIARVRGEIEQMEAEQKSLEHRVEFATVNLTLNEEYKEKLVSPAISAGTRLHNALVEGYREASETVLGILLFFAEYTLTFADLGSDFGAARDFAVEALSAGRWRPRKSLECGSPAPALAQLPIIPDRPAAARLPPPRNCKRIKRADVRPARRRFLGGSWAAAERLVAHPWFAKSGSWAPALLIRLADLWRDGLPGWRSGDP